MKVKLKENLSLGFPAMSDTNRAARDIYSPKVLVIPRNRWLRLNMTEKLFTGTLNHNQNKTKKTNRAVQSLEMARGLKFQI